MIEMFIIAAIVSSMTLRVAGNVAVDGFFAARGKESPRYTRAKSRRTPGAATRYFSEVWDDVWTGMSEKRSARKSGRTPDRTPKPRGAATQFLAGWWQDRTRAVRRAWDDGWTGLDEKRRTKATRPRPGQVTVPGTVVPNMQDEDEVRPQDESEDRPGPEPRFVPDEDGRTDLRFGEDEDDPTGVSSCPECKGTGLTEDGICLSCRDRQEQRNQHYDDQDVDETFEDVERQPYLYGGDDPSDDYITHKDLTFRKAWLVETPEGREFITEDPEMYSNLGYKITGVDGWPIADGFEISNYYQPYKIPAPPTPTEGTPTMSITVPTGEVTSLSQTIRFCEDSAQAYTAQVHAIEQTMATLSAEDVSGPAQEAFSNAMELSAAASGAMMTAAAEFKKHLVVQEAYDAAQGAGTKKFVTSGR